MSERPFHLAAGFGTLVIAGALAASVTILHSGALADTGPNLAEMEAIEASLAYKKSSPQKQPQKKFRAPEPEEKPEGVSHDENKAPTEPDKKDDPKRKPDENFEDQYKKFQRKDDSDLEPGKPTDDPGGAFDGSEFGWAEETKGDPFFQKLIGDARAGWEYPEILKGAGVPVGCVHITPEGKIAETMLKQKSGDDALDDSVERALASLKKKRNDEPQPVPSHLLRVTRQYTCIKFNL